MMIEERKSKPAMKELKVNIPVKYHLQLHTLKVMEGRQIHGVIREALDAYFDSLKAEQPSQDIRVPAPVSSFRRL